VDVCVSPKGDLIVACHSGLPDWGSGPSGKGKLYKISYTGREEPLPVLSWAASPTEVRIAFDRPLDPGWLANLKGQMHIERGVYVRAGDRFESLRPGYAIVQMQLRSPRYEVPVLSVNVSPDRRMLMIATTPQTAAEHHAITLPRPASVPKPGELPQHATIDLDYDLCGMQAEWKADDGDRWKGWLPHPDLGVCRALRAGSAEHDAVRKLPQKRGTLTLRTKLDLWQMLRPAVQPGSRVDYTLPPEKVAHPLLRKNTNPEVMQVVEPKEGRPFSVEATIITGIPKMTRPIYFETEEDASARPLQLHRFLLPYAELNRSAE